MCNMGVRPVAIVLTHQFMTLQQVTELFVLYFTGQSSCLITMQANIKLSVCVMGELHYLKCMSVVYVCITPLNNSEVIIVWMDPCLTQSTLGPLHVLLCFCFYLHA